MKISVGADHGAVDLREAIVAHLKAQGHEVLDHGTFSRDSVDYPDFAKQVGEDLTSGAAERGVLICTTGIGMSISANKIPGIRAVLAHYQDDAYYARLHNNANVICFGQKHNTPYDANRCIDTFITTSFEGGRHERRVQKLEQNGKSC